MNDPWADHAVTAAVVGEASPWADDAPEFLAGGKRKHRAVRIIELRRIVFNLLEAGIFRDLQFIAAGLRIGNIRPGHCIGNVSDEPVAGERGAGGAAMGLL